MKNKIPKEITFVTTNIGKFKEVKGLINLLDSSIIVNMANIEVPEYQSLDGIEVAAGKAKEAWSILKTPLIIDDGGLYLEQYNQFPGTLSKYVFQGIGLQGLWKLACNDPRAYFYCCIIYIDSVNNYKIFEGKTEGTIIKPKESVEDLKLPFTEFFIPKGESKPLSELKKLKEYKNKNHRFEALKKLVSWLAS